MATNRTRGAERRAGTGREERAGQRRGMIGGALRFPRRLARCCDWRSEWVKLAREGNPRTAPGLHWQLQRKAPQNDTAETAWNHEPGHDWFDESACFVGYLVGRKKACWGLTVS